MASREPHGAALSNWKSRLLEYTQARGWTRPVFDSRKAGNMWSSMVKVNSECFFSGNFRKKKEAEMDAAAKALDNLTTRTDTVNGSTNRTTSRLANGPTRGAPRGRVSSRTGTLPNHVPSLVDDTDDDSSDDAHDEVKQPRGSTSDANIRSLFADEINSAFSSRSLYGDMNSPFGSSFTNEESTIQTPQGPAIVRVYRFPEYTDPFFINRLSELVNGKVVALTSHVTSNSAVHPVVVVLQQKFPGTRHSVVLTTMTNSISGQVSAQFAISCNAFQFFPSLTIKLIKSLLLFSGATAVLTYEPLPETSEVQEMLFQTINLHRNRTSDNRNRNLFTQMAPSHSSHPEPERSTGPQRTNQAFSRTNPGNTSLFNDPDMAGVRDGFMDLFNHIASSSNTQEQPSTRTTSFPFTSQVHAIADILGRLADANGSSSTSSSTPSTTTSSATTSSTSSTPSATAPSTTAPLAIQQACSLEDLCRASMAQVEEIKDRIPPGPLTETQLQDVMNLIPTSFPIPSSAPRQERKEHQESKSTAPSTDVARALFRTFASVIEKARGQPFSTDIMSRGEDVFTNSFNSVVNPARTAGLNVNPVIQALTQRIREILPTESSSQSPVTQPPMTQPPVTQPPVTQPPQPPQPPHDDSVSIRDCDDSTGMEELD
jgi:hypothetical protein